MEGIFLEPISSDLIAAYQATLYCVNGCVPEFTLRIGQHSRALADLYQKMGISSAAFITAWNPNSQPLPADVNDVRQKNLIACLLEMGVPFYLGEGSSPDGKWREPSLLALGIKKADARALAAQFEQNAFVYCDQDAIPELILMH